jgi:hypothetical protein
MGRVVTRWGGEAMILEEKRAHSTQIFRQEKSFQDLSIDDRQ